MAKAENVGWVVITENICIVYQAMKIMGFKRYIHGVQPASSCLRQPAAGQANHSLGTNWEGDPVPSRFAGSSPDCPELLQD